MGWHKITVDGRVMWESPDGQRVADLADIERMGGKAFTRTIYRTINGVSVETVICWVIIALAIGAVAGGHFQKWLMLNNG